MSDDRALTARVAWLWPHLDERARRLFAASEARQLGRGGVSTVSRACGLSRVTITQGLRELDGPPLPPGRVRRPGGGRPLLVVRDPDLPVQLEALVEPLSRGDPASPLRWTSKSTRALAAALTAQQHPVSHEKVAQLLRALDYSLQATRKMEEGTDHPDRDAQFEYINTLVRRALRARRPVISVDTKKKELLGNYQNAGRQWRPVKSPLRVQVHDFPAPSVPRAYPYGIYDLGRNTGFVNVGTGSRYGCLRGGLHSRLVARRGAAALPARAPAADYRRRRRQQRLPPASVEGGAAALCGQHGARHRGLPLPPGHQQMEQGGAPAVLVHLLELAGGTAARLRDDRAADREHDHRQRADRHLWARPTSLPCGSQGL